jgi:dephospho-CoA kinase
MIPRIIAICGAKRSGKDVLADFLIKKYGYNKIKFADLLKDVVKILFDFSNDQLGDSNSKDIIDDRWSITPRQALQFFGTEILQYKLQELLPNIDKKFLTLSLLSKIKDDQIYVISDLRFLHEYEELKKLNAFIIRIDRLNNLKDDNHVSEKEYINIPYNIYVKNNTNIENMLLQFDSNFENIIKLMNSDSSK